jgi:hypothetical protein
MFSRLLSAPFSLILRIANSMVVITTNTGRQALGYPG